MAASNDNISMAVFCDFENVALGVRDANFEKFDIKPVLERLLLKGSIVVKKAYCDWERYKGFKATMHEANFELIEIPHVRQSGKNSADIRLVVDALDLCYTKSHVNTFVIISGDSDFSPLVSKLRENAKQVIGVGVKQSTSDLLIANCDEFIFYDDLVRESRHAAAKRDPRAAQQASKRTPEEDKRRKDDLDGRKSQAIEMAVETFDALVSERGDSGKIWASMLKEAIKRRKPDFSESYYGFRTFGNLLEEAQARGLLEFGRDEKSGAYVYRSSAAPAARELPVEAPLVQEFAAPLDAPAQGGEQHESRRRGRGGRKPSFEGSNAQRGATAPAEPVPAEPVPELAEYEAVIEAAEFVPEVAAPDVVAVAQANAAAGVESRGRQRGGRKPAFGRDEKPKPRASAYRSSVVAVADGETFVEPAASVPVVAEHVASPDASAPVPLVFEFVASPETSAPETSLPVADMPVADMPVADAPETRRKGRGGRKPAAAQAAPAAPQAAAAEVPPLHVAAEETLATAVRKPAARGRRPRKTEPEST